MNKISVVIPAYNAAKTVEQTVRGVLQSSVALDVWVVDDGSTDETGAVLDRLAAECSAVHVIHQENQGAYMARLNALRQIKSEWFGFVDADDQIDPHMFETMLDFGEHNACDVVQCGVDGVDEDRDLGTWYRKIVGERESAVLDNAREVRRRFFEPHLVAGNGASFIWNKIYRNRYDFSSFVTFDHLTNYDDMIFNFQFFANVRRMGFVRQRLYHYARTEGSATHSYGARQFYDFCACAGFRRTLNLPPNSWFKINLRSSFATVIRSRETIWRKMYWTAKLLGVWKNQHR